MKNEKIGLGGERFIFYAEDFASEQGLRDVVDTLKPTIRTNIEGQVELVLELGFFNPMRQHFHARHKNLIAKGDWSQN